jgi:amino acid adenylation domain-containing protein
MEALVPSDRILFESFGQGELVILPHTHIHHAFERYAREQPCAEAVRHEENCISYGELDYQAERLARRLIELGVKPGDRVALFLQRSIPMVVGIFGILKAGAAYVPQDVRLTPEPMLRHILYISGARVVLTISSLRHLIPCDETHVLVDIDDFMLTDGPQSYQNIEEELRARSSMANCCFVLFTSGTTGKPNGVQVTHHNVCNILLTKPGNLGIKPGAKVSQILNIAFDMAEWEILGALSHGATLIIRGKSIQKAVEQADVVIATPSILSKIDASCCHHIKTIALAGEPCPKALADKWVEFATLYNCCGPTEVTIVNTMQAVRKGCERLTIGKPTPNNTVYLLDEALTPCKIGEIGEIWAGGDCVSLGYLADENLTCERYKPDPFLGGGRMMFRTRDLGRWTDSGELEHFGRTDDQVKIRGFRVELDSVSNALETLQDCEQAVTLKLDDHHLVSFVRPSTVNVDDLREAVARLLPYYCTPSLIVPLDEFPATERGKIDKRALIVVAASLQKKSGVV